MIDTAIVVLTFETSLRAGVVAGVVGEETSSVFPVGFLLLVGFFLLGRSLIYADIVDALEALSGACPCLVSPLPLASSVDKWRCSI